MKPQYLAVFILVLSFMTGVRLLTDINRPATRWDEQTNITLIRETLDKQAFPVLSYRNKPFFEKPPLWYYLNMGISKFTGITPVPMRVISLVSGTVIILLSVWWVWGRFGSATGLITWTVLLLSRQLFVKDAGGIFSSHTLNSADPDSLQIGFMLIAFSMLTGTVRRSSWIIAGLATGLAVLTKGPLGFIPLLLATVTPNAIRKFPILRTWMLAAVIILPWYLAMTLTFGPSFLDTHFRYHIITRAVSPIEGNGEPLWFFLGIIANPQMYPVFPLAALSLILWFKMFGKLSGVERYTGFVVMTLLIIPSLMRTKLSWYILPLYPFMAILTGMMISKVWKPFRRQ